MRWREKIDEDEREMRGDDESIGGCTAFGWGEGLALAIVSIIGAGTSIDTGNSIDTGADAGTMTY